MTTETRQLEMLFERPAVPEPEPVTFFCITHQAERPLSEQSADPRYCKECLKVIRGGEAQSYPPIKWIAHDLIEIVDGRCFALDKRGQTWDVGDETSVRQTIETGKISPDLCPDHRPALKQALEILKEIKNARDRTDIDVKSTRSKRAITTGGKRARPTDRAQHKPVNTRHLKARKGFSRRSS